MVLLYYLFVAVVLIQIVFYGWILSRFSFAIKQQNSTLSLPVSVIISCRNEAENLQKNLPEILRQDYDVFEVVLVDDASTDATLKVMKHFQKMYPRISLVEIPKDKKYFGNKKRALQKGISQATYKNLVFTDADCLPVSRNWLSKMAASFSENKQLVLGYGPYKKQQGLLNKLIRYETVLTAWQYFSYALLGMPYMGVGRNMGYTKSLFNRANGFTAHKNLRSGDDDLFVSQMATKENTAICFNTDSFMYSDSKERIASWISQKRRHITTASYYRPVHKLLLGGFYISQWLFFVVAFFLLVADFKIKQVLLLIIIRYVFYYINFIPVTLKLKETDLLPFAPFLELYLIVIQLRIFIANLWQKPKEW